MQEQTRKKIEFSKKLLYANYIIMIIITILAFILMWRTNDLSPLGYIITGIFAEVTAATGFYYWKAKNENMLKIKGGDKDGTNQLETETYES